MKRRILSLVLVFSMLLSLCVTTVSAAGTNPFTDVSSSDWYYDGVQYAYENGLMNGTGSTTFSPAAATTRGMIVTILWRLAGSPTAGSSTFTDVADGQYYANAVTWAADKGIVTGYNSEKFGPNDSIQREQMAAILYRYAKAQGYDTTASAELAQFADLDTLSSYAEEPMAWAVGTGLITGTAADKLSPKGTTTRAQAAVILMRFCEACGIKPAGSSNPSATNYTVTFDYNYDSKGTYKTVTVNDGDKVTLPTNPTRSGYTFSGWYTDKDGKNKFNANDAVTGDITVYAKWSIVSSGGGGGGGGGGSVSPATYTVTFNGNAEDAVNVPASQTVRAGATISEPATPTREGYTFVAWYSDSATTVLYDFSSAVSKNTTLYAKWRTNAAEIISFLDEPDPDVEIYTFTTDTWDIQIGTAATVTFTAEIFANIALSDSDVALKNDEETVIGYMRDDGMSGDEIANDGIYTVKIELESDTVETVAYHVTAKNVESNSVTIGFYTPHTEEDYKQVDDIAEMLNAAISSYINENGYLLDGKYDEATTAIKGCLSVLINNGSVVSYSADEYSFSIELANGIPFLYQILIDAVDAGSGISRIATFQPYKNTYSSVLNTQSDSATDGSAEKIAATAANKYSFVGNFDLKDVNLARLKTLSDYSVILWHGHGGYSTNYGSYICTGEIGNRDTNAIYDVDISNNRILYSSSSDGSFRYMVTGGFFDKYIENNSLSGAFVYLGTCSSGKDMVDSIPNVYSLVQSFIDKGARTVFGNSDTIYTDYNTRMMRDIVSYMCNTDSIGIYYSAADALLHARELNGQNDGHPDTPAKVILFPQNNFFASNFRFISSSSTGTIAGNVKCASDNSTVSNALVRIYDTNGTLITSTRTGDNGGYTIDLPAGNYIIKITAGRYRSEKMAVTVTENTTVYTETFLMLDNSWTLGSVSGSITNSVTGMPVSDVTLRLRSGWNNKQGTVVTTTTSNSNGSYEISYKVGIYTMEYSRDGFITGYKNIVIGVNLLRQNVVISPLTSDSVYRIVLSWSNAPEDLDSHLAGPLSGNERFHLYYPYADANDGSPWPDSVKLDLDNIEISNRPDIPETTTILHQITGPYVYSVHDYSNSGDASSLNLANSRATVVVYKGDSEVQTFHVPTGIAGTIWNVFELSGDTIVPINRFGNGSADDIPYFDPYLNNAQ